MSIPKEPRQLMINLMYLVLTALLALNVSAEVMNAFFSLDKSIATSNKLMDGSNSKVVASMEEAVKKRKAYAPLVPAAKSISGTIKDFNSYIDGIRDQLTESAGGLMTAEMTADKTKIGKPKRSRDKEIPTRMFIEGDEINGIAPIGPELREKIAEVQKTILSQVEEVGKIQIDGAPIFKTEDVDKLKGLMTLEIDDEGWQAAEKPSWEHFTFDHMPVAAVYPILRKFQNDAKSTEASILNELANRIGATTVEFDKFEPVASAEKGYLLKGEKYKAEIFLSAASSQAADGMSYTVNGSRLPIKDGKGVYTTTANKLGENSYTVNISMKNPFTGKVDNFKKQFKYEVGQGSMSIELEKMNVFYIGVDNPIAVAVAGAPSGSVKVSGSGCNVTKKSGSQYNVTVSRPGDATINVSAQGLKAKAFKYRVKRIPDPKPLLGTVHDSKAMGNGTFKAQGGIAAVLPDFDFDVRCNMAGFDITYVAKRQDAVTKSNRGARYSSEVVGLVKRAKPGDIYYFDNIKAKCPGDVATRKLGGLVFKIQ